MCVSVFGDIVSACGSLNLMGLEAEAKRFKVTHFLLKNCGKTNITA